MKATKILLSLAVMGTLTLGFADASIDTQIEAIQSAAPADRVTLMNEFKTQLSNMNTEDRSAAIATMQTKMQEQMASHGESGQMTGMESMRENAHETGKMASQGALEHASEMQMEHGEEMNRMQNMNQQQAGSQFGHENERNSGTSSYQGSGSMFGTR